MANTIHVEFAENHTDEVLEAAAEQVAVALEAVAMQAENYAKLLCPVDTGNLRNSISHEADDQSAVIGTNVEYASYVQRVEMGTSRQKAQPYLEPALSEHLDEYEEIIEEYLTK